MPTTIGDIIKFANANRVAYMATVHDGQPRVRAFDMWKADETGFYFHNNKKKDIFEQSMRNSMVQLFFPSGDGRALRVEGKVELLDAAWNDRFYGIQEKTKFKDRSTGDTRHKSEIDKAIFRVSHGNAWFRPAPDKHTEDFFGSERVQF